jgi:hypothetical protein
MARRAPVVHGPAWQAEARQGFAGRGVKPAPGSSPMILDQVKKDAK